MYYAVLRKKGYAVNQIVIPFNMPFIKISVVITTFKFSIFPTYRRLKTRTLRFLYNEQSVYKRTNNRF